MLQKCADSSQKRMYFAEQDSSKYFKTLSEIKKEIQSNGPISATIPVFPEYLIYKNGTYASKNMEKPLGFQTLKIVGWGKDQVNQRYWVAESPFGRAWGEEGLVRIHTSYGKNMVFLAGRPKIDQYGLSH